MHFWQKLIKAMFSQYDKDGNKKWYNSNYFIFEIILIIIYILWGFNNSFILLLTKKVVYIFKYIALDL